MTQYKYRINGKEYAVTINSVSESDAQVEVNGSLYNVEILREAKEDGQGNMTAAPRPISRALATPAQSKIDKSLKSPLPGVILAIKVKEGDIVKEGQTIAILEAMKMENEIHSEFNGKVTAINVEKGDSVLEGSVIVTIE